MINAMNKQFANFSKNLLLLFLALVSLETWGQQKFTLSGSVYDFETGETVIGARIAFPTESKGVMSNAYGFYSISMPAGTYEITVSFAGYETILDSIVLTSNITKDFKIKPKTLKITELEMVSYLQLVNSLINF